MLLPGQTPPHLSRFPPALVPTGWRFLSPVLRVWACLALSTERPPASPSPHKAAASSVNIWPFPPRPLALGKGPPPSTRPAHTGKTAKPSGGAGGRSGGPRAGSAAVSSAGTGRGHGPASLGPRVSVQDASSSHRSGRLVRALPAAGTTLPVRPAAHKSTRRPAKQRSPRYRWFPAPAVLRSRRKARHRRDRGQVPTLGGSVPRGRAAPANQTDQPYRGPSAEAGGRGRGRGQELGEEGSFGRHLLRPPGSPCRPPVPGVLTTWQTLATCPR